MTKDVQLNFRVPNELYQELIEAAKLSKDSRSEFVRKSLAQKIKQTKRKQPATV